MTLFELQEMEDLWFVGRIIMTGRGLKKSCPVPASAWRTEESRQVSVRIAFLVPRTSSYNGRVLPTTCDIRSVQCCYIISQKNNSCHSLYRRVKFRRQLHYLATLKSYLCDAFTTMFTKINVSLEVDTTVLQHYGYATRASSSVGSGDRWWSHEQRRARGTSFAHVTPSVMKGMRYR
jgi:hypothetical protein